MEQLIEKSASRYQAMLDHLQEMAEMLKTADPASIQLALAQWNQLQQEAQRIDHQLDQECDSIAQCDLKPQMQHRTELMAQVALQCRKVYSQANLLKALVGDELNRLHQGRKALGGYKGTRDRKGSRFAASS